MKRALITLFWPLLAVCAPAQTQPSATGPTDTHEVDISGSKLWTDTGVDVTPGQSLTISATGSLQFSDGNSADPQGAWRGWKDLLRSMPVNSAGRGALIGRIGSDDAAQPFLVGAQFNLKVRVPGRLFLGFNGTSSDTAQGSFHATIQVSGSASPASASAPSSVAAAAPSATGAAPAAAVSLTNVSTSTTTPSETAAPASAATTTSAASSSVATSSSASDAAIAASLPKDLFSEIPRRITDKDGNIGDMVNFLLIGTEDQVKATFQAAGWVQVDRDVKDAILEGFVTSLSKQAYLTMPMSQLYLFGRPQDYGFAHAEPLKVVTTRHHLRVWKSTLTIGGAPVWVGAATHDMGLERDQRNGKLTHHIDPNVDDERGFVERSLTESGYISQHTHILPPNPVQDAKTATGGGFHSNGEVLVMWLSSN
jgi:hypothetical protein